MSRINTLTNEEMSPRQRETYQRIAKGPRKGVNGPFAVWLRTPEFADRAEALGNCCRFESTLFQRAIELTILLVARHWQASFAWNSHVPLALSAGITEGQIEAIRRGETPLFKETRDQICFAFVEELLATKSVGDHTWSNAVKAIGENGVIDLIGLAGYHGLVTMTLNACKIESDVLNSFPLPSAPAAR